ncbi:MAG: HDOD domain-containing protein [Pseudomonadota bacterium]
MSTDRLTVVETALQQINEIATLPEIARAVMAAADNPETSADDIEKLVSSDAVLAARVLKVVNSSFYGMPGEVGSIHQAVVMLGLNAVKNIAIAASLGKLFRGTSIHESFDARELWQHSTAVACASRMLAKQVGVDPEQAFLCGMLHKVGFVVAMQFAPEQLGRVIDRLFEPSAPPLLSIEAELLGATHEEFGRAFCAQWQFPKILQEAIGSHHDPSGLSGETRTLAAIICVSNFLSDAAGVGFIGSSSGEMPPPSMLEELGVSDADIELIVAELPAAIKLAGHLVS